MHQSVVQNFQFGDSRRVMKVSKLSDQEIAGKSENHAGIMVFPGAIFTARKRSLGQGNILTGVCLSTGGGGSLYDVTYCPGGVSVRGGLPRETPPPPGTVKSRRYVSYWNTFLFSMILV